MNKNVYVGLFYSLRIPASGTNYAKSVKSVSSYQVTCILAIFVLD